jgi:hypothetical protein
MRIVTIRSGLALCLGLLGLGMPATCRAQGITILGHQFCCSSITVPCSTPPWIRKKAVCKPISNPCNLEGAGYYPTCWTTWTGRTDCPCPNAPALPLVPKRDANGDTLPDKNPDDAELAPHPTLKPPMKDGDKDPEKDPKKDPLPDR